MNPIKIYNKQAWPYAQRTRIVLSEKNIPFEVIEVDLKNKPDWFLAVSPYGKVPVVQHEDHLIYESAIINEYLEEVFPDVGMLGNTPYARAEERIWIDFNNTRFQSGLGQLIRSSQDTFEEKRQAFEDAMQRLEEHLEQTGRPNPYYGGERINLVDATYAPTFERMAVLPELKGYEIPGRFPRVKAWIQALESHQHVQATATPYADLMANYKPYHEAGQKSA